MTRAMCLRTSKRKHLNASTDTISVTCKENSPHFVSQSKVTSNKRKVKTSSSALASKENMAEGSTVKSSVRNDNCMLRKSERNRKSPFNNKEFVYNVPPIGEMNLNASLKRNVLSDKTNASLNTLSKTTSKATIGSIQTTLRLQNCERTPSPSSKKDTNKGKLKCHIPVYKALGPSDVLGSTDNLPPEKKEALYEFDEVDENEPVKKRKKKKGANTRKPKTGPKALRINNIKYSSTESLASLPERPVMQKKSKPKMTTSRIKSYASVSNLNNCDDTCYSVKSFMSHPPSLLSSSNKKELKNVCELSVLQETQSENCHSPIIENINSPKNVEHLPVKTLENNLHSNLINMSTVLPSDSILSHNNSIVSHQRCYPSKKSISENKTLMVSQCGSINDTLTDKLHQSSSNFSMGSSHDFLSSTPCKRTSMVVCHNSVFSDSYDRDLPVKIRPSTGFIKGTPDEMVQVTDDNCFGFDEPEELEEPLLSPIKNINLQQPRILPRLRHELSFHNDYENVKPDIKEVIERLKATIPKTKNKDANDVFESNSSSSDSSIPTSPISKEVEATLSFVKPPRRSYERQRRVRHFSEHEEEDNSDEEEEEAHKEDHESHQRHKDCQRELKKVPKPAEKCYQKRNVSKAPKVQHVPKAKLKMLKEEEELEKLAAQMNAQFQQIEKCSLVVE